jgi:sulfide:quinone oxidoreductase
MQALVVAENIDADMRGNSAVSQYKGYGSCPLKAEKGRIVLAEFVDGGKLLPSFPAFLIDGAKPSRAA